MNILFLGKYISNFIRRLIHTRKIVFKQENPDTEKLLILADAMSDAVLGGERGWERMDFKEFVSLCRKSVNKKSSDFAYLEKQLRLEIEVQKDLVARLKLKGKDLKGDV